VPWRARTVVQRSCAGGRAARSLNAIRSAAAVTNHTVMRRNRLLLLVAVGLAVGVLVVLRPRTPTSTKPEHRPAPPVEEPRKPALQADARSASGEILYSARDSFVWHPGIRAGQRPALSASPLGRRIQYGS